MELPAVEAMLAAGDSASARGCVPAARQLPEITHLDNFILECWGDITQARMGGGFEVVAAKCRAREIDEAEAAEVWHRARLIERTIQEWHAAVREARENLQT